MGSKLFSFVFFLNPSYLVKVFLFERGAGVGVELAAKSSVLKLFLFFFFFFFNFKALFGKFLNVFRKILGNQSWKNFAERYLNLNLENKGIKINGEFLNNLRFADDVVVVAKSAEDLRLMLKELSCESHKAGMVINLTKTKILNIPGQPNQVKVVWETIEAVIYLGQLIISQNQMEKEVDRRIALAWSKFWSLGFILKNNFPIAYKSHIFNSRVVPALTYGYQTWSITKKLRKKFTPYKTPWRDPY